KTFKQGFWKVSFADRWYDGPPLVTSDNWISMRLAASLLALVAATPLASAQQTALSEDFSSAQFPPSGWTQFQLGPNFNGWARDAGGQRAWHEDFTGSATENYLISPVIDLSTFTQAYLHFEGEINYAQYRANHANSVGDGITNVEVTTDGGTNWTVLWTDTSETSGDTFGPTVDLSAYAGMNNVQIAFYFYGSFAHETWIDNIIVDDTPVAVLTSITNPGNGHPYFLLGQSDFATAQAMAISLGGSLVSIESLQENNWVKNQFGNFGGTQRNLMIGLHDTVTEGSFEWISGEAFLYENWAVGEPNDGAGGEDYVHITSSGEWNDFDGSGSYGVVEISEPRIQTTPLVAGQVTTITVNGLRVDSEVVLVFSVNGAGPVTTPFGVLEVDLDMISPRFPAISGQYNFDTLVPSTLSGRTLYGQGVQFNSDGSTDLSAAFAEPIQ
ncbi:MAG: lectin-like protein, partial [Planctomycetota bacterium]